MVIFITTTLEDYFRRKTYFLSQWTLSAFLNSRAIKKSMQINLKQNTTYSTTYSMVELVFKVSILNLAMSSKYE